MIQAQIAKIIQDVAAVEGSSLTDAACLQIAERVLSILDKLQYKAPVIAWLSKTAVYVGAVKLQEATVSKRQALTMLYNIGRDAGKALEDSRKEIGE